MQFPFPFLFHFHTLPTHPQLLEYIHSDLLLIFLLSLDMELFDPWLFTQDLFLYVLVLLGEALVQLLHHWHLLLQTFVARCQTSKELIRL